LSTEQIEVNVVWRALVREPVDPGDVRAVPIEGRRLRLAAGSCVADALAVLGVPALADAVQSGALAVAVYGERARPDRVLAEGDRIELLGALIADPKQSRGRRAQVQRTRAGDARWTRRDL
jgi:putative ubiquitin-RnfH superfamily antitoxin RatB of RatAB toxin-antitoxin module